VTNVGNVQLHNINVTDSLTNLTEPIESIITDGLMEEGETWTYTGNYAVTQQDLDSNGEGDNLIKNTATVQSEELEPKSHIAEVPLRGTPAYTIDKGVLDVAGRGSEGNVTKAGDTITYQIRIHNFGNVDLNNVTVTDSLINLTGPVESPNSNKVLDVAKTWTYTGTYTVTQQDLNSNGSGDGFINNTATVDCDQLNSKNANAEVPVERHSTYCLYKSVIEVDNGGDCIVDDAGDIIRYRIVVKNEGNVDLTNISVNDTLTSLSGPTGDDLDPGILNPGEIWKFYGNYTVTQADINNNGGGDGDIDNTATVSCDNITEKSCSVSQPISQDTINGRADLCIYKSALGVDNKGDCIANEAGDIIEYQVVVKNEGIVDLTGVSVSDPMISLFGPVESKSTDGVLSVDELWVYKGNYTLTQEDIANNGGGDGYIDNSATVSCSKLSDKSSSIKVPIAATQELREDIDSESNNTSNDTSNGNSISDDNNNDESSNSENSGNNHGGSGIGSVHIISNTAKNDKVNETSVKENDIEIKAESDIKDTEETTQNETIDVDQQTADQENTKSKSTPAFEMVYGITGLLVAFIYKRIN